MGGNIIDHIACYDGGSEDDNQKQTLESLGEYSPLDILTRRSVEHCTPHADGAWLNELGWSQL